MKKGRSVTKVGELASRVTSHLHVTSLELAVDELMANLGEHPIDLSNEKVRARFRDILMSELDYLAFHLEQDYAKAASLGISDMSVLIRSPDYYAKEKKKRERDIARMHRPDLARRIDERRKKVIKERRQQARAAKRKDAY